MESKTNVDTLCLDLFAGVSAAISHEIKNTLSVINESAGLLDDLATLTEDDRGVPKERVQAAASTVMKQVARANTIMRNLNRLAHSVDIPVTTTNLSETLSLLIALTSRKAAGKRIITTITCREDLELHTHIFVFEALLYRTLCRLYKESPEGSTIRVDATQDHTDIIIHFTLIEQSEFIMPGYPGEEELLLAKHLRGNCQNIITMLILTVPTNLQ